MTEVSGTWRFNETLNWPAEYGSRNCDLGFSVPYDNLTCIELNFRTLTEGGFSFGYYGSHGGTMSSIIVYSSSTGWVNDGLRTIELYETQEMTEDFYEWFTANAVPVTPTPVLNPTAILMGYSIFGEAIRRMRDKVQSGETDVTEAILEDGVLYIINAKAVQDGDTLEVT